VGQSLPIGAECHFTADLDNGYYRPYAKLPKLTTSCTVHENGSAVILPITCSNYSSESECSCQCAEGFKTETVDELLTCLSKTLFKKLNFARRRRVKIFITADVDECSEGTHNCDNVSRCVDVEGSYYCTNESETTTSTSTSTSDYAASSYSLYVHHTLSLPGILSHSTTTTDDDDNIITTTSASTSDHAAGMNHDIVIAYYISCMLSSRHP
jgi:hypothetical protein